MSVSLRALRSESGVSADTRVSVRLILTGGDGLTLAPVRSESGQLFNGRIVVICKPASVMSDSQWHHGFTLKTCDDARNKELVDVKSSNYLWNMMCLDDALIEGFDDALFVNRSGEISEASTSSFVWMSRDEKCIYSAPQESNVLPGTTLMCLQNALEALGHSIRWRALRTDNLAEAVACAVISSVRGLVPIRQIDQHAFDVVAFRQQLELWNQALYAEQLRNCESLQR
jgi:branched-subunit amino acid aminotransferase/4-amino-4-deoxychorismate lyase